MEKLIIKKSFLTLFFTPCACLAFVLSFAVSTASAQLTTVLDFTENFTQTWPGEVKAVTVYNGTTYALVEKAGNIDGDGGKHYMELYDLSAIIAWKEGGEVGPAPEPVRLSDEGGDVKAGRHPFSADGFFIAGHGDTANTPNDSTGQGMIWTITDVAAAPSLVDFVGSFPQTEVKSVTPSGFAVGHGDGTREAIMWDAGNGSSILDLPALYLTATAESVGKSGRFIVGETFDSNFAYASLWGNGNFTHDLLPLDLASQFNSVASAVSPSGRVLGGRTTKWLGGATYVEQAILWEDVDGNVTANQSASDFQIVSLFESDGTTPFEGEVLDISDTGYAVGTAFLDGEDEAFLYHASLNGGTPLLLSAYVEDTYGVILPTGINAGRDIHFDGTHLWIAGSSLVLALPVAHPTLGDFNFDDQVDGVDLAQWQGDFGLNADSDADLDTDTDGADFLVWQRGFGVDGGGAGSSLLIDVPAPGGTIEAGSVPEPSSLVLALVLGCGLSRRRFFRSLR